VRRIIVFNLISLDGYFAGPKGDISWHMVDQEFNEFAVENTKLADTIIFGRKTYQLFEDFWPKAETDPKMSKEDLIIAKMINKTNKIVYSRTLKKVAEGSHWKNITLLKKIDPQTIKK